MYKDCTAAELASLLTAASRYRHNTANLSMLDEATLAFSAYGTGIGEAQRNFASARHRHHRSYDSNLNAFSEEAWNQVIEAAKALAALLDPLGELRIPRCKRLSGWGVCGLPLDDDGICRSSLGHTDGG